MHRNSSMNKIIAYLYMKCDHGLCVGKKMLYKLVDYFFIWEVLSKLIDCRGLEEKTLIGKG